MDPLSISSSIIGLLSLAIQTTQKLKIVTSQLKGAPSTASAEIEIYSLILREVSENVLHSTEVPPSAISCLQLCQNNLGDLGNVVSGKHVKAEDVHLVLANFRRSVLLLRDVVMDSVTHTLIREQREAQARSLELELEQRGGNKGDIVINLHSDASSSEDSQARLSELFQHINLSRINNKGNIQINIDQKSLDDGVDVSEREDKLHQLKDELHKLNLRARSAKNPFTTLVHVLQADQQSESETIVAKLDTQSSQNWVSVEIVQRLAMISRVEECEPDWYQGAGGERFQASGRILLKWYETMVAKTRETSFLVNSNTAPFDMILGWEWIKAEGPSAFAEPVLAMREMDLTEDQHREMQANILAQDRADADIVPARRAQAANKRDLRRLEKAANASRVGSTVHTRTVSPTSSVVFTRRPSVSQALPGASHVAQSPGPQPENGTVSSSASTQ
ncbi:hypothetical protein LTR17_006895 [Elasticomyces elasticus]|nr:hypothetical protein LTR17_006895 [Elasticomyces elasticus]